VYCPRSCQTTPISSELQSIDYGDQSQYHGMKRNSHDYWDRILVLACSFNTMKENNNEIKK
jgi:hypothetical protein